MNTKTDRQSELLDEAEDLLESMVAELRFRSCDEHHPLIKRAMELGRRLKTASVPRED